MTEHESPGEIIIYAGAHASGKDTLEAAFTASRPDAVRHVRFTTRDRAPDEIDGQTYHFVSSEQFETLAEQDFFIDYVRNPVSCGGVSRANLITDVRNHRYTSLTMSLEEGLSLYDKLSLEQLAGRVTLFCIAPCTEQTMLYEPDRYLGVLARRLLQRGRTGSGQGVVGRLKVAEDYRKLYIANRDKITLIANEDNKQNEAIEQILRALDLIPAEAANA